MIDCNPKTYLDMAVSIIVAASVNKGWRDGEVVEQIVLAVVCVTVAECSRAMSDGLHTPCWPGRLLEWRGGGGGG